MTFKPKQILFVELLGGIGDVLIALSAIQAIARTHPQAELTVLTFAPGSELLAHDPLIHRVVSVAAGQARVAVEAVLAQQAFDLIVSDTTYDGIADLIQASSAQTVTNLWRSPPDHQFVSDRFLEILQAEGVIDGAAIAPPQLHLTDVEQQQARQRLGGASRPIALLFPDAGMAVKRWHPDRFVQLGQALQRRYGASIVVPIAAEPAVSEQIAESIGGSAQILQRGTIRELAAAIAQADLFVGADTGAARIAAALGVPTVTLFGPSWHGRYGQPAPHANLQGYPECPERVPQNFTEQSCWYGGVCPLGEWQTCLEAIAPADVLRVVEPIMNALPAQSSVFRQAQSSIRNILAMRMDNIGDVIMVGPALRALKQNLPQARLTLMASPGGAIAAPLLPWVDEVLPWRSLWQDLGRLAFDPDREWQLIDELRSRQFDAAFIFTSFSQSPHPPALICALAGIPLRIGESKETDGLLLTTAVPSASDAIHQVDRNLRLVEAIGFPIHDRSLALAVPSPPPSPPAAPYFLLNPWTSCESRNYDVQRFATAARQLAAVTGYAVAVTGVEKDRDRSAALLSILGDGAIDLIGKTTLAELTAWIANAQLVLTNNTSTMHIADAVRTPTVVLFAGTELECQWQPRHTRARLLRRPTACSPCYAFTCPYDLDCLDIPAEQVVAAALELLSQSSG